MKPKQTVPASRAINWYIGNFIMNYHNALRDDDFDESGTPAKKGNTELALKELEELKVELKDNSMTHKELLDLVKERRIHDKYYKYKKPTPTTCAACRIIGSRVARHEI